MRDAAASSAPASDASNSTDMRPSSRGVDLGPPGPGLLHDLPSDVLEKIFVSALEALPELSAVSRRFRALVVAPAFDELWLGQSVQLLGAGRRGDYGSLRAFGAARHEAGRSDAWRAIATELRCGRLMAGLGAGTRPFDAHPAALSFDSAVESAAYFRLLRSLGGAAGKCDWLHLPLVWSDRPPEAAGSGLRGATLVEEWLARDRSVKVELDLRSEVG
eukprot:COSAG01_NODE_23186_length_825_cov_0.780992_1_plen_217_part_01